MKSQKREPSAAPEKRVSELFADFVPAKPPLEKYGVKFLFDCEICGARMIEHHCKVLCPGCGYIRDCSDP